MARYIIVSYFAWGSCKRLMLNHFQVRPRQNQVQKVSWFC